ncbi:MAG: acetolactate decarboxylase [Flavobacteriales bacterium]|nr:acetolactate decarboxylase [Flavobacteriales bacterium]
MSIMKHIHFRALLCSIMVALLTGCAPAQTRTSVVRIAVPCATPCSMANSPGSSPSTASPSRVPTGSARWNTCVGELLVIDGHCYVATATSDSTMMVTEQRDVSAPFFVHQRVNTWTLVALPDSVIDLATLDAFLTTAYGMLGAPFAFKLTGTFTDVDAHIVDVPPGTEVHGPDDAHRGNKSYHLSGAVVEAVGFFSTRHKAVFTHHDTNIHVHAMLSTASGWGMWRSSGSSHVLFN